VIGAGSIGRSVGRIGLAFEMRVLFHDTYVDHAPDGSELVDLEPLLRRSDVVTVHCPLTPETKGLLGREQLRLLKPQAIVVNTARGGIIDEAALADALEAGALGGAAIDVFEVEPPPVEHRLMKLACQHHVIVTPHIAWAGEDAIQSLCDQVIDAIDAFHQGNPINRVA
jgi:glycerate dehydrogenase